MYIDSITPPLHGIFWWRTGAFIPTLLFLAYALFLFPAYPRFAIPFHIVQLAGLIIMMSGITAELVTRQDFPQFGRTALVSSLIICIFADFAFAGGARRYLAAILLLPLAVMSVYITVAGQFLTQMERLFLICNPFAMAVVLSFLALYQERSNVKEFKVRSELRRAENALGDSEKKYHDLFENAEVGMFQMRLNGSEITDVNRKCLELTGRTRQEMVGRPSTIHWADPSEYERMMRALARDGRVANCDCRIRNARGEERNCLISLSPLPKQQIIEGSLLDITERKRLEAEREAVLRRLEFLIETTRTGLDIIDEDYGVQYVDPARLKVMGDPNGKLCYEYFMERSFPCDDCGMQKALKTRKVYVQEQTLPNDGNRPTQITSLPYQNDSGKWLVAEVVVDISERKKAEAERLDLERRIADAQKLEGLGILAGGVAHNFNNLLTVILGHADLLKESLSKDVAMTSSVLEIIKASDRSRELVSQLLSLGKQQVLELRPLDLNRVVRECAATLRQALRESIAIDYCLSTYPCPVAADPGRIEQILLNFVSNAQDAIPREGRVEIATAEVVLDEALARRHQDLPPGRYIKLTFSDTGEGMAAETLRKIFTPFFTTKEQGKGTGLGLFTAYGIVKQHNGKIEVESNPGAGTRFTIYLPRIELPMEKMRIAEEAPAPEGTETVLLVEDEVAILMMLSVHLQSLGYKVLEASDGMVALRVFSEYRGVVHILVTDVVMPRMNGTDLHDRLRQQLPELKVLFMSGYPKEVIGTYAVRAQEIDLMQKPFTGQALASRVREILDR
jgi:PAS domain S-box-containing protein